MTGVKIRILSMLLLVVSFFVVPHVFAQANNADSANQLAERCNLAQNYIKNIQKPRDLRARVDRLQAYRYIASRLDNFVTRLERNRQPNASELRETLKDLNVNIDNFKNLYEQYDKAREEVVAVQDCQNNRDEFQAKLEAARLKRSEVNDVVNKVQSTLSPTAKDQLNDLYAKLLATAKTNEGNL